MDITISAKSIKNHSFIGIQGIMPGA